MPFLQELLGGGQQKPTAQQMAGGIPQNADPGKRQLFGDFAPPPVTAAPTPDMTVTPAQLKPQQAPIAPVASPPAQMGPVGGPPMGAGMPMGGGGMVPPGAMNQLGDLASQPPPNPMMQQALMERLKQLQAGGR
jgi:hypothetical protein